MESDWSCSKKPFPRLSRVAVLYDLAVPLRVREVKEVLPVAARALGLTLQHWGVRAADEFDRVFASMTRNARVDSMCPSARSCVLTENGSWGLR